jgi:hypothetical protein
MTQPGAFGVRQSTGAAPHRLLIGDGCNRASDRSQEREHGGVDLHACPTHALKDQLGHLGFAPSNGPGGQRSTIIDPGHPHRRRYPGRVEHVDMNTATCNLVGHRLRKGRNSGLGCCVGPVTWFRGPSG